MSTEIKNSINEVVCSTRRYKVKKNQFYTIPSKGMIRSWRVVDDCKFIPILYIDDKIVRVPREDKNYISISHIRNYIRSLDAPESPVEVELDRLENVFYNHQLYGIEYYSTLTDKELFDCVFTRDIKVQLSFGANGPEEVEIEEEYWDRKGAVTITQTDEDIEMMNEIDKLEPLEGKMVSLSS